MVRAVDRAREIGATTMQVFGDNPTAWRRRRAPAAELPAFRQRLAEFEIAPVAIHASYLINLAGPDAGFFERSVDLLTAELREAPGFGATLVNVHVGSHRGTSVEAGIDRLAAGIAQAYERLEGPDAAAGNGAAARNDAAAWDDAAARNGAPVADPLARPARVVLENSAGGGWAIGATLEELRAIAIAVDSLGVPPDRVGFCLDVAHLWGAGYRMDEPAAIDDLVDAFETTIGLDRLAMIHFNDSKTGRGSNNDRHEHIGAGAIGPRGLAHLLRHPRLTGVAYLLETPGMEDGYDAVNMARARDLAAGRALAPLPAAAMNLTRSRARTPAPESRPGAA